MAEVVKCGFIADPRILDLVEADPVAALDVDGPFLRQLVERAIRVKADVVTADLRESALREILNYGHTFGHAVEQVEGYRWRHGEAVSVGHDVRGRARPALRPPRAVAGRPAPGGAHQPRSAGDATRRTAGTSWSRAMRRDKKARGSRLRFVVLDDVAVPVRLEGPPDAMLRDAYDLVATDRLTRAAQEPPRRPMGAPTRLLP